MRSLLIVSAAITAMTAGGASAQRMIAHGPGAPYAMPGAGQAMAPPPQPQQVTHTTTSVEQPHGNRWGSKVGGYWWGGANAPGGWNAYRQPHRGWRVPGYWNASRFYIPDWAEYGLSQPPFGYNWARYYDDAVLIDDRGSVYDTVGGLDWDGYDAGYPGNEAVYSGNPGVGYSEHRSSGPHRSHYGADYGQPPVAPAFAPPPPPGYAPPPPRGGWVSPDGTTTVTTTTGGYGGGSTTTVVVQSAPIVTTTTTEIYEDAVTYSRPHKVWRKRVWHRPVWHKAWHKPACGCR